MFTHRACLHDDIPRFCGVEVDELESGGVRSHFGNQRADIGWKSRSLLLSVEVSYPCHEQASVVMRQRTATRELNQPFTGDWIASLKISVSIVRWVFFIVSHEGETCLDLGEVVVEDCFWVFGILVSHVCKPRAVVSTAVFGMVPRVDVELRSRPFGDFLCAVLIRG